jgi:hypothetical protein
MTTEKKKGSFSKIENRDDALKMVRDTSMAFYAIAGLQAVLSYWIGLGLLVDAAIYAIGGFFLRRFNSRAAAVVLLILALLSAGVTIANKAGADVGGGNNIILALVMLWAGIRAVEATFKLQGRFSSANVANQGSDA